MRVVVQSVIGIVSGYDVGIGMMDATTAYPSLPRASAVSEVFIIAMVVVLMRCPIQRAVQS